MKKSLVFLCAIILFLGVTGIACADIIWTVGTRHGDVDPIVGASEYHAEDILHVSYTLAIGTNPIPDVSGMPGLIGDRKLSEIVSDGRPLTDVTPELILTFDLEVDYSDLLFTYGRYGSEGDWLYSSLYADSTAHFDAIGSSEGSNQELAFSLGYGAAGSHWIEIDYVGGGAGNGHYIDYLQLQGTPVPEPATMLLLGVGLIGLGGLGRKRFLRKR